MLFRREMLERIASGEVTLALRRWKRATVKSGGRLRTSVGTLRIGDVSTLGASELTPKDAQAAGFETREQALEELGDEEGATLFRIELQGIEPDQRIALRNAAEITDSEWWDLDERFARWERSAPGYFPRILAAIGRSPEVLAATLASDLGVEKLKFKQDVRKLKELGLTESRDVGYRLSPRGESLMKRMKIDA